MNKQMQIGKTSSVPVGIGNISELNLGWSSVGGHESLERGDVISDPNTPIPGVKGWTYGQAVRELLNSRLPVDLVLFPFAAAWMGLRPVTPAVEQEAVDLAADLDLDAMTDEQYRLATTWTREDALSMTLECREEDILFGNRRRRGSRRTSGNSTRRLH
jgi:hypothetical protein